jgi:uracil-DNA glycosylase
MKVLVVGSNPSVKSVTTTPFVGTRSLTVLKQWVEHLGDVKVFMANVHDDFTEGNAPLNSEQIRRSVMGLKRKYHSVCPDKVIALGMTAANALAMAGIDHFLMPHPSGLNYKLNNHEYVDDKLNDCKEYVHGSE